MIRIITLLIALLASPLSAQEMCGESLQGVWWQPATDYTFAEGRADREALRKMYGDGPIFSLSFTGDQFFSTFYTPNNGSTMTQSQTFSINGSDANQCRLTIAFTEIDKHGESHTNLVTAKLESGRLCMEVPEANIDPTKWSCFQRS